jgi:hypothetical protein
LQGGESAHRAKEAEVDYASETRGSNLRFDDQPEPKPVPIGTKRFVIMTDLPASLIPNKTHAKEPSSLVI